MGDGGTGDGEGSVGILPAEQMKGWVCVGNKGGRTTGGGDRGDNGGSFWGSLGNFFVENRGFCGRVFARFGDRGGRWG